MLVTVVWLLWPNGRGVMWPRLHGCGSLAVDTLLMAVAHWPSPWPVPRLDGRGVPAVLAAASWPWLCGRGSLAVDTFLVGLLGLYHGLMAVASRLFWPRLHGRGSVAVARWPWTRF